MVERMKELINLLNLASKQYYNENRSMISDYEYDKLYDELIALENESGIVFSNSPTQNVGYSVISNLSKVKHDSKILSLDKTKDISKLKSFLSDHEGLLSLKLDGLTIVLKYNKGILTSAITRGNGEIGEDVTHNAKVFSNIPLKIKYTGEISVRGEAVISYSQFQSLNNTLDANEQYKNPRNLCSGTVRQLNSEITAKRNVMFIAFSLVTFENNFKTKSEALNWLKDSGFSIVEYYLVGVGNLEEYVNNFYNNISSNDFASDGLVLTYNDIQFSDSLGVTSKFPKNSIAFKWKDEIVNTTITNVIWNTSRTGLINPVAIFEPVELEGTTVSRASVHNVSVLEELELGIGDVVCVYKANMIIPQIAQNITKSANIEIPDVCPECLYETELRQVKEGKSLYCTNPNCKAQLIRSLIHFTSRDAMNIEGLSEKTIEKFIQAGFITDYTDIFLLHSFADKIMQTDGFKEKSCNNLIQAIERSKKVQLFNFIYALGINNVGLANAKLLCDYYNFDLNKIRAAQESDFNLIKGFGVKIAHSLFKYFNDKKNIKLLDKALEFVTFFENHATVKNNSLNGLTFVITGELKLFQNRKELQQKIESLGARVSGSISKNTAYLINNDYSSLSSKNNKAKELGIEIISEEDFIMKYFNNDERLNSVDKI